MPPQLVLPLYLSAGMVLLAMAVRESRTSLEWISASILSLFCSWAALALRTWWLDLLVVPPGQIDGRILGIVIGALAAGNFLWLRIKDARAGLPCSIPVPLG